MGCGTSEDHWARSQSASAAPAMAYKAETAPRSRQLADNGIAAGGAARMRDAARAHTRLRTSVPLVPPKPKLFLTATSIFMSRAVLAQ